MLIAVVFPGVLTYSTCLAAEGFGEVKAETEKIKEIILLDKDSSPLPFGGSAAFEAVTFLEGQAVNWSVRPEEGSGARVTVVENGSVITLTPTLESQEGYIDIEAWVDEEHKKSAKIYVGCQVCGTGDCSDFAGSGYVTLGSIDIRISLGKARGGMSAGALFIKADKPAADVFTPDRLEISSLSDEVVTLYQGAVIRQILTPQAFVIVEPSSPAAYEILFYKEEDRGVQVNGFYALKPSAEPVSAWRIENADNANRTFDNVLVIEFRLGAERNYEYTYSEKNNTWRLVSGNGLKRETRHEYFDEKGNRVERTIISGSDDRAVSVAEKIYQVFEWGEELVAEISDPDGERLTTEYLYYREGPGYGKRQRRINPDGSWVRHQYDDEGRIIKTVAPYLDAPDDGDESRAKVVINSYALLPGDAGHGADRRRPRTVTTLVNNTITARIFHHYAYNKENERVEISEQCAAPDCAFGDGGNLRTVTTYYAQSSEPESKKIKSQLSPDGRLTTYVYETGTFSPSADPARAEFFVGEGTAVRLSTLYGTEEFPDGIAFQTVKEITITDSFGNEVMQETHVKTGSGFERLTWSYKSYNDQGRLIETLYSNNTRTESQWSCCGKQSSTDIYGITTSYRYDELKRLTGSVNEATGLERQFSYDAAGRQVQSVERNGGLTRVQSSRFDVSGRVVEKTDQSGLKTAFHYDPDRTTITSPGGATRMTETYLDGRIKSVTGSAVVARYYRYGVNPDGSQWTREAIARDDSPRVTITTRDMLGRIISVEQPGYEVPQITRYHYNRIGQLVKITKTGMPETLVEYDELGQQARKGFDLNANGTLDPAAKDRLEERTTVYRKTEDGWWKEQTQALYVKENKGVPVTVSIVRTRLSGWDNNLIAEQRSIDVHGNETRTTDYLDRCNRRLMRRTYYPDSEVPAEQVYLNAQLTASQGKTGHVSRFAYDGLGRQVSVTDPRTGVATVHYNDKHQVDYTADAVGNRTGFVYDPLSGRRTTVINALGRKSYYSYNSRNQLIRSWGDVPYPVEYHYNEYNELVTMQTFRDDTGWHQEIWPETASGDTTSWSYQESTGLLLSKRDAAGNQTRYSYNHSNRLETRTDARGIITAYSYSPMGELVATDYSDDTPDLVFAYDRTGRTTAIQDAVGTRSFTYTDSMLLDEETIEGVFSVRIEKKYDDRGREQQLKLNTGYQLTYGYDATGRFAQIDWLAKSRTGSARYSYLENADLPAGYSSDAISVAYQFEPSRNLRTTVANSNPDQLISRYDYEYDRLGRRSSERQSGEAFDQPPFYLYDYNNRNEIKSSAAFIGNDPNDQTRPIPGQTRFYQYDAIGNRQKILEGAKQSSYSLNSLNQYTQVSGDSTTTMTHDANGNLLTIKNDSSDIRYSYNAENRLVNYEPANPRKNDTRVTFTYDYMGRRVEKKTFLYKENDWHPAKHIYFIYDGGNLLAEIDVNSKEETNYVWGLDLGGSIHGPAGGVGGLLTSIDKDKKISHYTYDNRGNVSQLINSDGTIKSTYQYDPYGNPLPGASQNTAQNKDQNPFRFSTKYHDSDLNLYNYGYRHYSPATGRWLTRDPIGELGGKNLYSFANNSINNIDSNGLYSYDIHYVAVFATLITAGKAPQDAWKIAYYSSYPDMDKRYEAFVNAPGAIAGSENSIRYQEYLHSLNGKDINEIKILRKCASCLIKADGKSMNLSMTDHQIDGVLVHLLGDTYSHLVLGYVWEDGKIVEYPTKDVAYSKGFGHVLDYKFPDRFPYRPGLANEFLNSVYSTFDGKSLLDMSQINLAIETIEYPKYFFSESLYDTVFRTLISESDLEQLESIRRTFNPSKHDVNKSDSTMKLGVNLIPSDEMKELLDVLIRCSEGSL